MSKQHYAFIPKTTLVSKQYKSLKKNARLLYVYIEAKRAGRDEPFTYSYKEMREDGGFRYETIAACIRDLEKVGLLEYEHGGLELNHNHYYIEKSWLELE